jgi:hypothetical protein
MVLIVSVGKNRSGSFEASVFTFRFISFSDSIVFWMEKGYLGFGERGRVVHTMVITNNSIYPHNYNIYAGLGRSPAYISPCTGKQELKSPEPQVPGNEV